MSEIYSYNVTAPDGSVLGGVERVVMSTYKGYLLKAADGTILDPFIKIDTYSTTPDQRQDSDSYRDGYGMLHRTVLPDVVTTIKFTTLQLTLEEKMILQDAINSGRIDKQERKTTLTYWNDEINDYCTDTFYIPDVDFPVKRITAETIIYSKVDFKFIGYGEERT